MPLFNSRVKCERFVSMIMTSKAGLARGIQGTESLWLDSKLSLWLSPPVIGALVVIGVSGMASLTSFDLRIFKMF